MTVPSIAGSSISTSADLHTVSPPLRFNQMNVGQASQTVESAAPPSPIDEPARLMETGTQVVWVGMVVWVAVSAILFAVSGARILRFHWLLIRTSREDASSDEVFGHFVKLGKPKPAGRNDRIRNAILAESVRELRRVSGRVVRAIMCNGQRR
jgi:hypothetical protein